METEKTNSSNTNTTHKLQPIVEKTTLTNPVGKIIAKKRISRAASPPGSSNTRSKLRLSTEEEYGVDSQEEETKVGKAPKIEKRLDRPVSAKYGLGRGSDINDSDEPDIDAVDDVSSEHFSDVDEDEPSMEEVYDDHRMGDASSVFSAVTAPSGLCVDIQLVREGYEELMKQWLVPPEYASQMNDFEVSNQLVHNFGVDLTDLDLKQIDHKFKEHQVKIETIGSILKTNMSHFGNEGDLMVYNITKAYQKCRVTYNLLVAMHQQKVADKEQDGGTNDNRYMIRPNDEDCDKKQKFILYLYEKAAQAGYRRYRGMLYAPVITRDGYNTHAYRECMSIQDFVLENAKLEINYEHWKYMTQMKKNTHGVITDLSYILEILPSQHLPPLVRDRHKFSFSNGILLTRVEKRLADGTRQYTHKFYPYNHTDIAKVDRSFVSANYFNQPYMIFEDDMDWYDIPTPVFQYIIDYQFGEKEDSEEIARMMYMNIGRMLYNRGDLDNWQYMCVFLGIAGTGKSSIIDYVLKRIYPGANRAEIDNTIEEQFGLGALFYDSGPQRRREIFMTTASELKQNCRLDLGLVLKMCSGEEITAAMKNSTPVTFEFPTHFIMAANTWVIAWKDDNGNVKRRVQLFKNTKKIKKKDRRPDLGERLAEELPNIIQKCVRAYLHYVNLYGLHSGNPQSIEMFEPKYFNDTRQELGKIANTLFAYALDSGRITISSRLVLSEEDFMTDYRDYCRSVGKKSEVSDRSTQFSDLAQTLNEYYDDDSLVTFEPRTNFMYEGQQHWQARNYFIGMGLSCRLSDAQREDAGRRLANLQAANAEGQGVEDEDEDNESSSFEGGGGQQSDDDKGKEEAESSDAEVEMHSSE